MKRRAFLKRVAIGVAAVAGLRQAARADPGPKADLVWPDSAAIAENDMHKGDYVVCQRQYYATSVSKARAGRAGTFGIVERGGRRGDIVRVCWYLMITNPGWHRRKSK